MRLGALGRVFEDGEIIAAEGSKGVCMYVLHQGTVEVVRQSHGGEAVVTTLGPGDVFGEMSLFTGQTRSATVRAKGRARVLTIDKRGFFRRIHEDPSLGFRILKKLSERVQKLTDEVVELRHGVSR